eukprot:jgi/Mesvir1/22827/Mv20089-RA.1
MPSWHPSMPIAASSPHGVSSCSIADPDVPSIILATCDVAAAWRGCGDSLGIKAGWRVLQTPQLRWSCSDSTGKRVGEGLMKAWAETPLAKFLDSKLRHDAGAATPTFTGAGSGKAAANATATAAPSAPSNSKDKGASKDKGKGKNGKAKKGAAKPSGKAAPAAATSKQQVGVAAAAGRPGTAAAAPKGKGVALGAASAAPVGGPPPLPPWLSGLVDNLKAATAGMRFPNMKEQAPTNAPPPQQQKGPVQQQPKGTAQQQAAAKPAADTPRGFPTTLFHKMASLSAPTAGHKTNEQKGAAGGTSTSTTGGSGAVAKAGERPAPGTASIHTSNKGMVGSGTPTKGPVVVGKGAGAGVVEKTGPSAAKPSQGTVGKALAAGVVGAAAAKAAPAAAKESAAAGKKGPADAELLDGDGQTSSGLGSLDHTRKAELGRATWTLLHMLAAQFPEKPTKQQQKDAKELIYILTRIYPCGECAKHFREIVSQHPPVVSSGFELQQYMCRVHNIVNRSLGKPNFPCHRVDARWGALDCEEDACDLEMNPPVLS